MDQNTPKPVPRARRQRRSPSDGIGERLGELRTGAGLKVSELARLVGVSPSLISQIERGQSRPSVATLFSLAKALNVPVDAFFPGSGEEGRLAIARGDDAPPGRSATPRAPAPGRSWKLPQGSPHRYLVRRPKRASLEIRGGVRWERLTPTSLDWIDFLELVYAPHAESDPELYRHPGIEMLVLLEGRLDIVIGFDRYELQAGDSIAFPSSLPHRYVNPSDESARAITAILRDDLSTLGSLP